MSPIADSTESEERLIRRILLGRGRRGLSAAEQQGILSLGPKAVPLLIEILDEDRLDFVDSPGGGYARGHAARAGLRVPAADQTPQDNSDNRLSQPTPLSACGSLGGKVRSRWQPQPGRRLPAHPPTAASDPRQRPSRITHRPPHN